jgi:hypothetical protein
MTTPKDIHPIVMKVLDELSEKYFIHKRPTIKKSDNLELGWEGRTKDDHQLHVHYGTTGTVGD